MKTLLLYIATAIAEIVGCYLPLLWLRGQGSGWVLLPAAAFSLPRLHGCSPCTPLRPDESMQPMGEFTWQWRWGGCGRWTASARATGIWWVWP